TAVDFAEFVRDLVDRWYPDAQKIVLVMDNLNTHKLASLYEAFAPEERGGWWRNWRSITRPSTAVGSTSRRSNSACSAASAWTVGWAARKNFAGKSRRGSGNAIAGTARWIGSSPRKTPASSCGGSIRQLRIDGVVGGRA